MNTAPKHQPLVSVVTPVYCQAKFLEATMRSVLTQDYPLLEYIVIDDGSNDESFAVAKRVATEFPDRVKVLTQANIGQAATLNKGWAMASGELLAYLSSDDCFYPQTVSRMVAAFQRHDVAVAYCDFCLIDVDGRKLREIRTEDFNARRLTVDLVCQPGPGAFFRRMIFERTGGWNVTLRQVPDFDFWLRAEKHGSFIRVAESLAEYRMHDASASLKKMSIERAEEIVRVVTQHHAGMHSQNDSREAIARANAIAAKHHAQSGRPLFAIKCFTKAIFLKPKLILELGMWRQLLSGLLRRFFYKVNSKTS